MPKYYKPNEEQLKALIAFVQQFGWDIAVENVEDDEFIDGLIIGEPEFLANFIDEDSEAFTIYTTDDDTNHTHQ